MNAKLLRSIRSKDYRAAFKAIAAMRREPNARMADGIKAKKIGQFAQLWAEEAAIELGIEALDDEVKLRITYGPTGLMDAKLLETALKRIKSRRT